MCVYVCVIILNRTCHGERKNPSEKLTEAILNQGSLSLPKATLFSLLKKKTVAQGINEKTRLEFR
jgi:hypothetical protein